MKQCNRCGKPFVGEAYRSTCLPCWKVEKGYDLTKSDRAYLDLQAEVSDLIRRVERLERMNASNTVRPPTIGLWRWMLARVHPDTNAGAEQATAATQWLLPLRPDR